MKKLILLAFAVFAFLCTSIYGQAPDTVLVPSSDATGVSDALTRYILGDTTASGARNNINRVYKLKRGDIYLLTGKSYYNFPLTLIADDDATTQPPVIAPFPLADGSIPRITFYVYGNTYFKNLYFQGMAPGDTRNSSDRPVNIGGDNTTFRMKNCVVEGFSAAGIGNIAANTSVFMEDCLYRNINNISQFNGQFFYNFGTTMDTISIVNCTYFNGSSYFLCNASQYAKYIRFEHNTLFINNDNPFYVPYLGKAVIKNNILFCPASVGETLTERADGYYDWDNQHLAVFSIDTIPTDMAAANNITEATRDINLSNNAYFWPQKIKDCWASIDSLIPPIWLNDRTTALFNDHAHYPLLKNTNNVEADPGFSSDVLTILDSTVNFVKAIRLKGSPHKFFYNPSGAPIFPCRWPIPENLAYSNTTLQTAADGGFPLGDLNWFPAKKKEWAAWVLTDVKQKENTVLKGFNLSQNFPNPFNPTTIINFNIPSAAKTTLKVFDVLGREVATLVNKDLNAGSYQVDFNAAKLSSGVYIYRIDAGSFSASRKMLLLK